MDIEKLNKIIGILKFSNSVADTVIHVENNAPKNPGIKKFEEVNGRVRNSLILAKKFDKSLDNDDEFETFLRLTPIIINLAVGLFNRIGLFVKKIKEEIEDEDSLFSRLFSDGEDETPSSN